MSIQSRILKHSTRRKELEKLLQNARHDADVLAVILFGSFARGHSGSHSDIDVCLVLVPRRISYPPGKPATKRLHYSKFDLDVHVFQQLPLYIRSRVLKEGKVLFVRDDDLLYDLALRTVRDFEDFKPIHQAYLKAVMRAR